jgi:hypothetical protein
MGSAAASITNPQVPNISDSQATSILTSKAIKMIQNIYSQTVAPPSNPTINLIPRNVGVISKFVIEVTGTLTNTSGGTVTLTDFGLANILSNVTFYDLNNNLRINTTGAHLTLLAQAKKRAPLAGCFQVNTANGSNLSQMISVSPATWPVLAAPQTIATGVAAPFRCVFEVPLAYSDDDLRGAIFANVVNTTMSLQITLNTNAFTAATDYTGAVYQGGAGTFTAATVNVYQVYYDQLPTNPKTGAYILPQTSLATVYELKNTNLQAITPGQDFPIAFTNFRSFLSAFVIYNNGSGGGNGGRAYGTDVNYFSRTTANFTNIFKYDPLYNVMISRDIFGSDLPAGTYLFSFRKQPVWTTQYGNQQINLNASTAQAGAYANVYWEDMALQNTLSGGASLPSN